MGSRRRLQGFLLGAATAALCAVAGCGGSSVTAREASALRAILPARVTSCPYQQRPSCSTDGTAPIEATASADGKRVAISYADGHVAVWDLATRRRIFRAQPPNLSTVALSPNGKHVFVGSAAEPTVGKTPTSAERVDDWSLDARKSRVRFYLPGTLPLIGATPDGESVLADLEIPASQKNAIPPTELVLIDPRRQTVIARSLLPQTREGFTGLGFRGLAYDVQGHDFVISSTGVDGYVRWRPGATAESVPLSCAAALGVSSDGSAFACNTRPSRTAPTGQLTVWDTRTRRVLSHWTALSPTSTESPSEYMSDLSAFLDGGRAIAVVLRLGGARGPRNEIVVYRISDHSVLARHSIPAPPVGTAGLSAIGDVLLVRDEAQPDARGNSIDEEFIFPAP
jgi:prepilin-type processing-associated H-X9-DG protein